MSIDTFFKAAKTQPMILGHRGSRGTHPENTKASFEESLNCGAAGFETDLQYWAQATFVVHDPIRQAPLAGVWRLENLMAWLAQQKSAALVNLEIKTDGIDGQPQDVWQSFLSQILGTCRAHPCRDWILFSSFDHAALEFVRQDDPSWPVSYLTADMLHFSDLAKKHQARWVAPAWKLVTPKEVDLCHQQGCRVLPWTANDPAIWKHLADAKVDAIYTDFPRKAVLHFASSKKI